MLHDSQPREEGADDAAEPSRPRIEGVLRLRGGPDTRPHVVWSDDVIDNEGMGKKKSKICCIYHKPKSFDESSDESSSDESDSSGADLDRAQPARRPHRHHHHHEHDAHPSDSGDSSVGAERSREGSNTVEELPDVPERNAYERQPKPKKGKEPVKD